MKKTDFNSVSIVRDTKNLVNVKMNIKCGSNNDTIFGIAHFMEHIFPKIQYKNKCLISVIRDIGAEFNAKTTRDITSINIVTEKIHLRKIMDKLVGAFKNFSINHEDIEFERSVIKEELANRSGDNEWLKRNQLGVTQLGLQEGSILGSLDSIEKITIQDIKEFYNRYYILSNVNLVLIGDVYEKEIFEENNIFSIKLYGKNSYLHIINKIFYKLAKSFFNETVNLTLIADENKSSLFISSKNGIDNKEILNKLEDFSNSDIDTKIIERIIEYERAKILKVIDQGNVRKLVDDLINRESLLNEAIINEGVFSDLIILNDANYVTKIIRYGLMRELKEKFINEKLIKKSCGMEFSSKQHHEIINGVNISFNHKNTNRINFAISIDLDYSNPNKVFFLNSKEFKNYYNKTLKVIGDVVDIKCETTFDNVIIYWDINKNNIYDKLIQIVGFIFNYKGDTIASHCEGLNPFSKVYLNFKNTIFEKHHYGYTFYDVKDENIYEKITLGSELRGLVSSIAVVGDILCDEIMENIYSLINKFNIKFNKNNEFILSSYYGKRIPMKSDGKISNIIIGSKGVSLLDHNKYSMHILWKLLDEKLKIELRDKAGLTYAQKSYSREYKEGGYFINYFVTENKNSDILTEKVFNIFDEISNGNLNSESINAAKNGICLNYRNLLNNPMNLAKNMAIYGDEKSIGIMNNYEKNILNVNESDIYNMLNVITKINKVVNIRN